MFEKSATTQLLYTLLKGVNGEIAYERLVEATGKPLHEIRSALASARRSLERDRIVFATVRGVGLRRLSDGEKARSTEAIKKSIRRASGRGIRRLNAIENPAMMSNADQLTATINRTIFEAIRSHTAPAAAATPAEKSPVPDVHSLLAHITGQRQA